MKFVLFHVHFGVIYRQLVNTGILTTRDVGSWWLSIPGAGIFMKNFSNGKGKMFSILICESELLWEMCVICITHPILSVTVSPELFLNMLLVSRSH